MNNRNKALAVSMVFSFFLLAIGLSSTFLETGGKQFFPPDTGVLGTTVILSTFILVVPQFLLGYGRFKEMRDIEEKFPDFLRDIVEALRSGLPLHQAIVHCSKFEYGRLSDEVKKMAVQVSWGLPLDKVMGQFIERVRSSGRVALSTRVMLEAYHSGGDVVSTLEGVADGISVLNDAEKEKKSLLSPYTIYMYFITYVFVAIVVGINRVMIPIFSLSSGGGGGSVGVPNPIGFVNPCSNQEGLSDLICTGYKLACSAFNIDPSSIGCYYSSLFLGMTITVAIFSGLIAGEITENSINAGAKHSIIMTGTVIGVFWVLAFLGQLTGNV